MTWPRTDTDPKSAKHSLALNDVAGRAGQDGRDGDPTPLWGLPPTTIGSSRVSPFLAYAVEEPYRRGIKGVRSPQESRPAPAGKVFHGRIGVIAVRLRRAAVRAGKPGRAKGLRRIHRLQQGEAPNT
ncbi:hypothetical protein [Streptosporangium jomthongense]|uniref:Uncharacterized protein n=1 Tax=Streptosporangium jomthongense TaxID=1193683 RepID=A0ABV8FCT9_9ACTN